MIRTLFQGFRVFFIIVIFHNCGLSQVSKEREDVSKREKWENGTIKKKVYSLDSNGITYKKDHEYYKSGKLQTIIYYNQANIKVKFLSWYENGKPERESNYKDDGTQMGVEY